MPFVTIQWGESPQEEDEPIKYEFQTFAEREAFRKGINESQGWFGYEATDFDDLPATEPEETADGWWFFVRLRLYIGEYEKCSKQVLFAEDFEKAALLAMENECHGTPEFEEGGGACMDMGEMRYRVDSICNLNERDAETLKRFL